MLHRPSVKADNNRVMTSKKPTRSKKIITSKNQPVSLPPAGYIVYEWDIKNRRVSLSGDCRALLGFSAEELKGSWDSWCARVHSEDRDDYRKEAERSSSAASAFHLEYRIQKKDGSYLTVQDEGRFVTGGDGTSLRMAGLLLDITEKIKIQQVLDQKTEEIQRAHRELQSAEVRIGQAEKMAALGTLLAGVTHELNNKFAPILGYVELLEMREKDPVNLQYLKTIEDACVHAKAIVADLLAFSRPSKNENRPFYLMRPIENVLRLLHPEILRRGVRVKLEQDDRFLAVRGDEKQMGQVFLNVFKNGMDAMEGTCEKVLTVSLYQKESLAVLAIKDTGSGIPPQIVGQIFDPFFTTKKENRGTGLGLTVSHGIVQHHGGKMTVKSQPGQGTEFTICLPLTNAVPQSDLTHPLDMGDTPSESIRNKRILIADDDLTILQLLESAIQRFGFSQIKTVATGEEALNVLAQEPYDLILADIRMPGIGGLELYKRIAESYPELKARMIMITGDSFEARAQDFWMQHEVPFILKPFHLGTLRKLILNTLGSPMNSDPAV